MKRANKTDSFEKDIARSSLVISLFPTGILILCLSQASISIYLKMIIFFFCALVIGIGTLFIWRRVRNQIRTTTNIVEALLAGDSSMRPNSMISRGALAELNQVINGAALQLSEHRQLSKEHQLAMSKVLEHIDVAVICLDENYRVSLLNPKAQQLFSVENEMLGMPAKSLGIENEILEQRIQKVITLITDKVKKRVYLQTDSYQLNGQRHILLFLNDVQQLLQNEERLAWQRLLRVLSHEINNSLAPIASIGESLSQAASKNADDPEFQDDLMGGLRIITQRALALDSFIKQYQSLSKLPEPNKSLFSLKTLLLEQLELFPNISAKLLTENDIDTFADRTQLSQVLVNLLKNAEQAVENNQLPLLEVNWFVANRTLHLQLQDNGKGISNPDNLFVPFYTTKSNGNGIGLVLSRQILFNHSGDLSLSNRETGQGAIATLSLPVLQAAAN